MSRVSPPPWGIRVLNGTQLSTWYDEVPVCMLRSYKDGTFLPNASYNAVLEHCKNISATPARYPYGFKILPSSAYSNKVRSVCCVEDLPLVDRGFDWVMDGYEDGTATPVLDMFLAMSKRNLSILTMGDSVNRQFYGALVEELIREGGDVKGTLQGFPMHGQRWWFEGLHSKVLATFPQSAMWTPNATLYPGHAPWNTVYIYDANMWYFSLWYVFFLVYSFYLPPAPLTPSLTTMQHLHIPREELWIRDKVIPQLFLNDHPSGLVFYANLGHHLANERKNADDGAMYSKVSYLLNWLYALSVLNPGSLMVWRESTPVHFDSPDHDGQFEKWERAGARFSYNQPNYWDHTMYGCRAIDFDVGPDGGATAGVDTYTYNATAVEAVFSHSQARQFKENAFVRDMLAVWECWDRTKQAFTCDVDEARARTQRPPLPPAQKRHASAAPPPPPSPPPPQHNIRVLQVFEFLAPFHGAKYGNCGGYDRIEVMDCVHYCSNAVPMWMPVWYQMAQLVEDHVATYDARVAAMGKAVGNVSASPTWFQRLPTVAGYVPRTEIQVVKSATTGDMFLLYHGMKRRVPDLLSLDHELWEMNSDTIDPVDPDLSWAGTHGYRPVRIPDLEVATVTDEALRRFPEGLQVSRWVGGLVGGPLSWTSTMTR